MESVKATQTKCAMRTSLLNQPPQVADQSRPGLTFVSGFWVHSDNAEQDLAIVKDIYDDDAYRTSLLSDNAGSQVVVDIGAHIGCFARLWHKKNPEARIICVEACSENLDALRANVGEFAEIVAAACTYEPGPMALLNAIRPNCESTGGSVVVPRVELETTDMRQPGYKYWNDLRELPKVTLEDLMERFGIGHIDVLKLDCEGSEYSILGNTPSLARIRIIVGEYHFRNRWDAFRRERMKGWDYGHMLDAGERGGLFHYANPVWPPQPTAEMTALQNGRAGRSRTLITPPLLRVAVPAGIGDSVWALMKIPALLRASGAEKAHVALCGGPPHRAGEFVARFDFVASVEYSQWECIEADRYTREGVYNWAPSGTGWHHEFDWMLQANRHLESGRRLESWLPEYETEWQIADRYFFTGKELRQARLLEEELGPFCVFYLGPEAGNTTFGHNRGPLWKPEDWGRLATYCRWLGLHVVVVGAEYDRSYFERHSAQHIGACYDAIGKWPVAQTFAVIQRARFVIGYQSGIAIFSVYLGIPTACFWRPQGDSLDPEGYVSFSEQMASAWVPQEALDAGRYLPLIYARCTPESIADHAARHGWHRSARCDTAGHGGIAGRFGTGQ
jgi:FkbM family methyltransferase